MNNNNADIINAHNYSSNHKKKLLNDKICGCFYCLKIFSPSEITNWINDIIDRTAICPYCVVDSIIGEGSGYPIKFEFLKSMNKYWF